MVQSVSSWQSTTGSEPCRLRIGHVNVYHLYSKVQNVCMLPTQSPYVHLLGLSETRLDSSLGDESLSIPNYTIIRGDAAHGGQTGMVLQYSKT